LVAGDANVYVRVCVYVFVRARTCVPSAHFLQLDEDSAVSNAGSLQLPSYVGLPSLSLSWNALESHLDQGAVSQSDMTLHSKLEAAAAVQSGVWMHLYTHMHSFMHVCLCAHTQPNIANTFYTTADINCIHMRAYTYI
jgi:hypothetical protein